ncbi:sugar ABC transporter substrate-binding protein [Dictyobacter alpinus]|uniref:Sugar ABC transporter substrate-binding protein n=1 Tax=Dictyobacter alpinus TaxID=2014873 RepID=A0A402BH44_9CHLR|nr:ABC transporter substrate-binding protein [Dictyobacter alpinus]GCE30748.1 sugar ABC transporter substrate-binding protein [Dictyobacter alpinus]
MKRFKSLRLGISLFSGFLVCGALMAGCGDAPAATNPSGNNGGTTNATCSSPPALSKTTGLKVGFSQNESNGPWRVAETKSLQDEATKRGVTLSISDAASSDAKQIQDVKNFVSQKVDVIILAPHTEKPLAAAVQAAKAACIPVFLIDRDVDHTLAQPNKDYVTFIGSDFVKQGQRAADWLIAKTGGKGNVIELEGSTGASAATNRKKGFDEQLAAKAPGLKIIASQDGDFNRETGRKTMQTLLQAHPEVTAVYAHNDEMAIGAITALKAAGKKPGKDVIVVSIDGEKDALNAIISGELGTTVQSSPFFGPVTFDSIEKYGKGTKLDDWIVVQDQQFTKDNAQANLANSF